MKRLLFSLFAICFAALYSCSNSPEKTKEEAEGSDSVKKPEKNPYENAKIEVKIFKVDSSDATKGYGYDIYVWGGRMIHQPNIPAVPGNNGFKNQEYAKKAGEFAAMKIKKNIMPPGMTPEELDSLGVLQ